MMHVGKDKGGIFGFGILGSREKMEKCHKTETFAPLHIDVDANIYAYGSDSSAKAQCDRDNWIFDNFEHLQPLLEDEIKDLVVGHGYPGPVVVHVRKTGGR